MSKVYPALLKRFTITFEKIGEVLIFNDFLTFIYQISIEFWITNTLLHKFFSDWHDIFRSIQSAYDKIWKMLCGDDDTDR